ncbi:hypothetical protein YC2023_107261 [Brassica napus]
MAMVYLVNDTNGKRVPATCPILGNLNEREIAFFLFSKFHFNNFQPYQKLIHIAILIQINI